MDQLEETEQYLMQTEKNIEQSFGFLWKIIYKCFFAIAGGLEYIVKPFMGSEEEVDEPF